MCGPCPRQKFVEPIDWVVVGDAREYVGEISLWVDAVQLTGLDQRSEDGPVLAAVIGSGEERILASEGHRPFILPMSGRSWKSITDITPISARKFWCVVSSSEQRANS